MVNWYGWYNLVGYIFFLFVVVFCSFKKFYCVFSNSELCLWYGEDLKGYIESDNIGKMCVDVYGFLV